MSKPVIILMATFQGADFIREQLDSIIQQSYQNIILVIRDDNSTDHTCSILQEYKARYSDKMVLIWNAVDKHGAIQNFSALLSSVPNIAKQQNLDDYYIMFSDQDDVWLENKVQISVDQLQSLEQSHVNKPLLVHSNLHVVDNELQMIDKSFVDYQNLSPYHNQLKDILFSNTVTGSTALFNRMLLDKACPVADDCIMHDWWLALVACTFGKIYYINKALVLYRQHDANEIGARKVVKKNRLRHLLNAKIRKEHRQTVANVIKQAKAFKLCYENQLDDKQLVTLNTVINTGDLLLAKRLSVFFRRWYFHYILQLKIIVKFVLVKLHMLE